MRLVLLPLVAIAAVNAGAQTAEELEAQLLKFQRVYVERFGGGEGAEQVRDMVIAALQRTRLFVLTETPDRADAVLRGSAEDLVFTDTFQSGDSLSARTGVSVGRGSSSSRSGRSSVGLQGGISENENTRIQERKHEASASVRLVNRDGDIVWSTTQESQGAKYKSASADVADKITRRLQEDYERLLTVRRNPAAPATPAAKPAPGAAAPGAAATTKDATRPGH
jgi:hypothetical protein